MADYTNKYVDSTGVKYLWQKAESIYMKKDGNKVLSDENFTTIEKEKLASLENYECLSNMELDLITCDASSPEAAAALFAGGGEITLSCDITLVDPVDITKNTVLDLSNHQITTSCSGYSFTSRGAKLIIKNGGIEAKECIAQAVEGGEVIIENGSYTAKDISFSSFGEHSRITVNGGNITGVNGGIGVFDGAELEINDGFITGKDGPSIFTNRTQGRGNNSIVINDGEFVGSVQTTGNEACGIYIANNDTLIMNGGSILANDGAGLVMRAGNVTINNGVITSTGTPGTRGKIDYDETNMSKSAIIYHESANYPGNTDMKLIINNGKFIGVDKAIDILSNKETPNISIVDGNFYPELV